VAGDQVMAAVVPTEGFDPTGFAAWCADQPDCSPQWVPRFLRLVPEPPRTPTGKVVVRSLAAQRWDAVDVWIREGDVLRPMTPADATAIEKAFAASGRALL
jgi:fatty-acyl-CoA synthase